MSLAERQRRNPFITGHYSGTWDLQACDVESRLRLLQKFTPQQCRAALKVRGLQATVRLAIERRLRRLEKEARP